MFPNRYFPNAYFAPRYWPKVGATPSVPTGIPTATIALLRAVASVSLVTRAAAAAAGVAQSAASVALAGPRAAVEPRETPIADVEVLS